MTHITEIAATPVVMPEEPSCPAFRLSGDPELLALLVDRLPVGAEVDHDLDETDGSECRVWGFWIKTTAAEIRAAIAKASLATHITVVYKEAA